VRVEHVDDADDERLRDFTHLRDVQLRSRREPEEGLFLAEGEKTIRRALEAGFEVRVVLCTERWLPAMEALVVDPEAVALIVDDEVLSNTTGFPVHRGAIASFHRRPLAEVAALVEGATRICVLEDLSDHTNLGAIFRSAAAMGIDAVLLTPRCADPLYRRAVRTSMGAVFSVPWTRIDWRTGPDLLREAGLSVLALTPAAEAMSISQVDPSSMPRVALALGSEGVGLSGHWLAAADLQVRIPMRTGVDSLNVGAAAAVAFYALSRL